MDGYWTVNLDKVIVYFIGHCHGHCKQMFPYEKHMHNNNHNRYASIANSDSSDNDGNMYGNW